MKFNAGVVRTCAGCDRSINVARACGRGFGRSIYVVETCGGV